MVDLPVRILENKRINGKYYKLVFRSKRLAARVEPGQFLNLQIVPGTDPFLRRPFSYYRLEDERIEILYEVLGRGTALLAARAKGDGLRISGPFGRAFKKNLGKKKRILVAGGVGVPPLVFLSERYGCDYLLIGTKSREEVLPKRELAGVRGKILYATNDGSYGLKGYVTKLLENLIKNFPAKEIFIQTCGPGVMMQAVIDIARREGLEGEASVDKPMACAVGACLGCMVKTPSGWVPSCTEGPVFKFQDICERL